MALKASQYGKVSIEPSDKNVRDEVVLEFVGDSNVSRVRRVVDDVDNEAQESVGQILPSIGSFSQAIAKEFSI